MQHRAVMFEPRSPDDILRTCRTPFVAMTFPTLATVVRPVSSQFQMECAVNSAVLSTPLESEKNARQQLN